MGPKKLTNLGKYKLFKRRKEGIKKKALELATLCDVAVCVLIQSPDGNLEIWPENPNQVRNILDKYQEKCPQKLQAKNVGVTQNLDFEKGDKVSTCRDDDLINGLSTDKVLRENLPNMDGFQHLEIVANEQNCDKVKEEGLENCCEMNAIDNHGLMLDWNQSLGPLEITEVYDVKPLQAFYPKLEFGYGHNPEI